jgi:uncharacterized phage protein gp47/JayE
MTGVTSTGFSRKLFDEIVSEIVAHERGRISAQLDVSERTVLGNLNAIFADHLSQVWELLEEAYNATDPDNATDSRLVSLALLTGVERRGASNGLVTATVNLDASQSFAAGDLVAHVLDEPSNRWVNRDEVTSTSAGNYSVVFESEDAGSGASAAAGTLTVIASPVSGWNSITNAADATPGSDEESIEDLRARREASLAQAGSGTVDAIRADLLQVDGVLQVTVLENTTDAVDSDGLPAHSFRAVIWDGSPAAADDDEIAQAIHDTRPAGIASSGSSSGNATTTDGQVVSVSFARATAVPIYIDVDVVSASGVSIADVRAAIIAAVDSLGVGDDVIFNRIAAAVFSVDGVDDFDFVQIGTAPAPSGTANISISNTQIATFNSADITVTGDAS